MNPAQINQLFITQFCEAVEINEKGGMVFHHKVLTKDFRIAITVREYLYIEVKQFKLVGDNRNRRFEWVVEESFIPDPYASLPLYAKELERRIEEGEFSK